MGGLGCQGQGSREERAQRGPAQEPGPVWRGPSRPWALFVLPARFSLTVQQTVPRSPIWFPVWSSALNANELMGLRILQELHLHLPSRVGAPHRWPVKPGDAAAHLRADDARGPWGAGLALETLWRESEPELAARLPSEARAPTPPPRPQTAQAPDIPQQAQLSCPFAREFHGDNEARQGSFTSCFPPPCFCAEKCIFKPLIFIMSLSVHFPADLVPFLSLRKLDSGAASGPFLISGSVRRSRVGR